MIEKKQINLKIKILNKREYIIITFIEIITENEYNMIL